MDHHSRFVPGHLAVILPNRLVALSKIRHGFWQLIAVSGNPHIQGRQQKDAEQQSPNQASDDDDGEGTLQVRPDATGKCAGSRPRVATSIVIMMGRRRRTAPSMAADSMVWPAARSWLMYSSMITPVCTETPKSAKKPTPEA